MAGSKCAPRSYGKGVKGYADGGSVSDDRRFRQMEEAEREAVGGEKPERSSPEPQRTASLMDRAVGAVKRAVGMGDETMSAPRNFPKGKKGYADGGSISGTSMGVAKPLEGSSALGGSAMAAPSGPPLGGQLGGPVPVGGAGMGMGNAGQSSFGNALDRQEGMGAPGALGGTGMGQMGMAQIAPRPVPPAGMPMPAGPPMGGRPMQAYADGGKVKKQTSGKGGKFVPFTKNAPKATTGKGKTPKGFEKPTEKGNVIRAFADGGKVNKRDMGKRR